MSSLFSPHPSTKRAQGIKKVSSNAILLYNLEGGWRGLKMAKRRMHCSIKRGEVERKKSSQGDRRTKKKRQRASNMHKHYAKHIEINSHFVFKYIARSASREGGKKEARERENPPCHVTAYY
jgi:hypothetical protein